MTTNGEDDPTQQAINLFANVVRRADEQGQRPAPAADTNSVDER